ncbi:hypothetical protein Shyd_42290 [Streptomyces hydrogenans]|uniref:Secreted protein n=1 Tax=Streptomyces hydrogenans TaxID=1873719 RepID=A0ABQ3PCU8_9ACTN|nr:hypothetical protein Shyd_42290 [Streptomyces hydrogenans]
MLVGVLGPQQAGLLQQPDRAGQVDRKVGTDAVEGDVAVLVARQRLYEREEFGVRTGGRTGSVRTGCTATYRRFRLRGEEAVAVPVRPPCTASERERGTGR